jgi:hypothetical protein
MNVMAIIFVILVSQSLLYRDLVLDKGQIVLYLSHVRILQLEERTGFEPVARESRNPGSLIAVAHAPVILTPLGFLSVAEQICPSDMVDGGQLRGGAVG